jgi:hypothetical protein
MPLSTTPFVNPMPLSPCLCYPHAVIHHAIVCVQLVRAVSVKSVHFRPSTDISSTQLACVQVQERKCVSNTYRMYVSWTRRLSSWTATSQVSTQK